MVMVRTFARWQDINLLEANICVHRFHISVSFDSNLSLLNSTGL
uniref:Uncharacterized protein n=1 Tax=Manihot esculenta TaxID=3983 RepID=A0A2C9WJL7_MANES